MKIFNLILVVVVCSIVCVSSHACKLGDDSTWHLKKADLIDSADSIVIAEAIAVVEDVKSPLYYTYDFKVIKTIKGKDLKSIKVEKMIANSMENSKEVPRGFYGTDCQAQVGFEIGKKYIIFPGKKNAWSWEQYKGESDPWLKEILKAVNKKKGS